MKILVFWFFHMVYQCHDILNGVSLTNSFFLQFESANIEKAAYLVYALACVLQIFLLCSCIQELLDVVIIFINISM